MADNVNSIAEILSKYKRSLKAQSAKEIDIRKQLARTLDEQVEQGVKLNSSTDSEKIKARLSTLLAREANLKLQLTDTEARTQEIGRKDVRGQLSTAVSEKNIGAQISAASRAATSQGRAFQLANEIGPDTLQGRIDVARTRQEKERSYLQNAAENFEGTPQRIRNIQKRSALSDKLVDELGVLEAAKATQKSLKLDPKNQMLAAQENLSKAQAGLAHSDVVKQVHSGAVPSYKMAVAELDQLRKALTAAALDVQKFGGTSKEAGDKMRDLKNKEVRQADVVNEMNRQGVSGGGSFMSSVVGFLGGSTFQAGAMAVSTASRIYQHAQVTAPLELGEIRQRYAEVSNERWKDQFNAYRDAGSLRRVMSNQRAVAADAAASMSQDMGIAAGGKLAGGIAEAGHAAVAGGIAGGGITAGAVAGMPGFEAATKAGIDVGMKLPQARVQQIKHDQMMKFIDTINEVPDALVQSVMDYTGDITVATRGMGISSAAHIPSTIDVPNGGKPVYGTENYSSIGGGGGGGGGVYTGHGPGSGKTSAGGGKSTTPSVTGKALAKQEYSDSKKSYQNNIYSIDNLFVSPWERAKKRNLAIAKFFGEPDETEKALGVKSTAGWKSRTAGAVISTGGLVVDTLQGVMPSVDSAAKAWNWVSGESKYQQETEEARQKAEKTLAVKEMLKLGGKARDQGAKILAGQMHRARGLTDEQFEVTKKVYEQEWKANAATLASTLNHGGSGPAPKAAAADAATPASTSGPIQVDPSLGVGRVSQGFSGKHQAIDIATAGRVVAPHNARIVESYHNAVGGNQAILQYEEGGTQWRAGYAHLKERAKLGNIKAGETVGVAGAEGEHSTGTHLHFTLSKLINGKWVRVDPRDYMKGRKGTTPASTAAAGATPGSTSGSGPSGGPDGEGAREAALNYLESKGGRAEMAERAGFTAKDVSKYAGIANQALGAEFRGGAVRDTMIRSGEVQRLGLMSAEGYIQAKGQLSSVGAGLLQTKDAAGHVTGAVDKGAERLESVLRSAVAQGMDSSKNIAEMVSGIVAISDKSAGLGVDVTSGAQKTLNASVGALLEDGVTKNNATRVAVNSTQAVNSAATDMRNTLPNALAMASYRQLLGPMNLTEAKSLKMLNPAELRELQGLSGDARQKKAEDLGVGRLLGRASDATLNAFSSRQKNLLVDQFMPRGLADPVSRQHAIDYKNALDAAPDQKSREAVKDKFWNKNEKFRNDWKSATRATYNQSGTGVWGAMTGVDPFDEQTKKAGDKTKGKPGGKGGASEDVATGAQATQEARTYAAGLKELSGGITGLGTALKTFYQSFDPKKAAKDAQDAAEKMGLANKGVGSSMSNCAGVIEGASKRIDVAVDKITKALAKLPGKGN